MFSLRRLSRLVPWRLRRPADKSPQGGANVRAPPELPHPVSTL